MLVQCGFRFRVGSGWVRLGRVRVWCEVGLVVA